MICDEYCAPMDSQMQLPIESKGHQRWEVAKQWRDDHPEEWEFFITKALKISKRGRKPSAKFIFALIREKYDLPMDDAYTSSFARLAMEEEPEIEFTLKNSMVDPFTTAKG